MRYKDLRDFIQGLEKRGELKRITTEINPYLQVTEVCDRTLKLQGPALLFENPLGHSMPMLANLFGTTKRVALGMGQEDIASLRQVGELLAFLKEPEPPKGIKDAFEKFPAYRQVLNMGPKIIRNPPCQEVVIEEDDVDAKDAPKIDKTNES